MVKNIQLNEIDTTVAAENFAKLLLDKHTLFLNGTWGSGKSTFLNKVEDITVLKIHYLDLWNIKDERSVLELGFRSLHPVIYFLGRVMAVVAVVISLLMTPAINLGLGVYFQDSGVYTLIGFIVLLVGVYQFFKVKSDRVYIWLFDKLQIDEKVLVIDDFDRASSEKQREAYKLFNVLNGRLAIVFVGDYDNLTDSGDFLKKIIDQRVELPLVLTSKEIWSDYLREIENTFDVTVSQDLRSLFLRSQLNLRDRKHYNRLVIQELIQNKKFGRVNIEQQLAVIYAYLFQQELYKALLRGELPAKSEGYEKSMNSENRLVSAISFEKTTEDLIYDILNRNGGYPAPFLSNQSAYLLYENVDNLSVEEAQNIISDDEKLSDSFMESEGIDDFYRYIESNYETFSSHQKVMFEQLAINYGMQGKSTQLILYVINNIDNALIPRKQLSGVSGSSLMYSIPEEWKGMDEAEVSRQRFNKWMDLLFATKFTLSDTVYFLENFSIFSYSELKDLLPTLNEEHLKVSDELHSQGIVLAYLSQQHIWEHISKWPDCIFRKIQEFSVEELLDFFVKIQVLSFQSERVYAITAAGRNFGTGYIVPWDVDVMDTFKKEFEMLKRQGYRLI